MSLEKKVSIGMFALSASACTDEPYSVELTGALITESITNSEGKAHFTDLRTGEEIEVDVVIDQTAIPVAGATIMYFNHEQFKGYSISHPAFPPQLRIALHDSNHLYSLTPAPLQILYNKPAPEKEQSKPAAESYTEWTKTWETSGWLHTGCFKRENMVTLMKPGVFLVKKLGIVKELEIESLGLNEEKFDEGVEYLEKNLPESAVADVYVFIPYQHGFLASTTTISMLDVHLDGKCRYGNTEPEENVAGNAGNMENGEGGSEPGNPTECGGTLFCDLFAGTALNYSKWKSVAGSEVSVYNNWLSITNPTSIATMNELGSCIDKQVELRAAPYAGSVFVGEMGLSGNKDTGILSCDDESMIVSTAGAENGFSLYKSGGLLSLLVDGVESSIPCSRDITSVQLSAGLNDKVKFDYVKVRCK